VTRCRLDPTRSGKCPISASTLPREPFSGMPLRCCVMLDCPVSAFAEGTRSHDQARNRPPCESKALLSSRRSDRHVANLFQ
jgi:hypothetical protein